MIDQSFDKLQSKIAERLDADVITHELGGRNVGSNEFLSQDDGNGMFFGLVYPRGANRAGLHAAFIIDEKEKPMTTLWLIDTPLGKQAGISEGNLLSFTGEGVKDLFHISTPIGRLILNAFASRVEMISSREA